MNNVILVTETGSDISLAVAKEKNITLVPMHVTFGTETLNEGTFPIEKIYRYFKVNEICKQTRMSFIPEELEYLKAGGRVSNASYLGSKILNIHPSVETENGTMVAKQKYRGSLGKVIPKYIENFLTMNNCDKHDIWLLWSQGLSNHLRTIAEDTVVKFGCTPNWMQIGGVITTHGGPSVIGIVGFASQSITHN